MVKPLDYSLITALPVAKFAHPQSAFYARKQLLLSARLSHRNSVRLSVTRVDQSKTVQARITESSPSAAWKTLVSGTVKLFHKFKGVTPNEGAK